MAHVEIPLGLSEEIMLGFARCHQLETWLRELVYLELKAEYGRDYWQHCEAALARAKTKYIPPERSLEKDQRHPHMATGESDPLWFVSFDVLLKILFDDALWPHFEYYLTTKRLLQAKLEEVAIIRNRIAHFRSLHKHDLDRIVFLLRELDPGIFKFCASYGDRNNFYNDELQQDVVYKHFSQGRWRERGQRVLIDVKWFLRPNANYVEAWKSGRGRFYHFVICRGVDMWHNLDYAKILSYSQGFHQDVSHITLDADQYFLHVTVPAVVDVGVIIKAAEHFYDLCENLTTLPLKAMVALPAKEEGEEDVAFQRRTFALQNRPFEEIALEWPHYVVPPSHPYAYLDSSCVPCNFFGV